MALTDSLTGLYNRRYLEVHLGKLIENNNQSKKALAVLIMDIDHFKNVNDTYGHNVGDEVLKVFAERLKNSVRSFDLIARYGGEEFVVILPDVSSERAYMVAERLRRSIGDTPINCSVEEGSISITTSIGGMIVESGIHNMEQVLERADKCLYEAKNTGRNRTIFENKGLITDEDYKEVQRAVYMEDQQE